MAEIPGGGEEFADVLARFLAESHTSVRRVSSLSGVSRRTIENWLSGRAQRPRDWEPLLKIAGALHLSREQTNELLVAAGLSELAEPAAGTSDQRNSGQPGTLVENWTTLPAANDLPVPTTPFVGRRRHFRRLTSRLTRSGIRLVTITGLGGAGKTRLALEAARAVATHFQHGVYHVPLDDVSTLEGLWARIIDSLAIPQADHSSTPRAIFAHLRRKNVLLLLDGFEQLVGFSFWIGELLSRTESLRLLITSRHALDLHAEYALPIDGLGRDQAIESPAYQLFIQSARRRVPGYTPAPEETAAVLEIVELVQGLPLALELAGAWVDLLSPVEINARLRSGLRHLSHPTADRPSRQHSLWAVFDSSFRLLSEAEQSAAVRLRVMAETFTPAAALGVAECDPPVLRRLLQSSLVQRGDDGRLSIHSLVRQFLTERAGEMGLDLTLLESDYAAYYLAWVAGQGRALRLEMSAAAVQQLMREWWHVERAWWLAVAAGRADLLDAAIDLLIYFEARAAWLEGVAFFRATQERIPAASLRLRARLDEAQAILALRSFDFPTALQLASQALNTLGALGIDPGTDPAGAYARLTLWAIEYNVGRHDDAHQTMETVHAVAGPHLTRFAETTYLLLRGVRSAAAGDWPSAHYSYTTALNKGLPGGYHVPNVRLFVGQSYAQLGDLAAAREQFELARRQGGELQIHAAVVGAAFELCYLALDDPSPDVCLGMFKDLADRFLNRGATGRIALHLAVAYLTQGLFARAGLLSWAGFSLLWETTEPPERAAALLAHAQIYLLFGRPAVTVALSSLALIQPGIDDDSRRLAMGLSAAYGTGDPADPTALAQQVLLELA